MNRRDWIRKSGLASLGLALMGPRLLRGQEHPATTSLQSRYPELKYINLAGNENPFGPSQKVSMAIMREVKNSCRYPFREEEILKQKIAQYEGVDPENIILGNGCDEILSLAGDLYANPEASVVATRPTYLQLMHYAEARGVSIRWVDHTDTMHHDLEGMANQVDETTSLVYICNPDTPSGTIVDAKRLRDFCESLCSTSAVFLDEVYLDLLDDFREQTQVDLVRKGKNVIIGRSFSKMHGLAGHRIGYGIARPDIARALEHRKMSSLNYLGVIAAIASLSDLSFHRYSMKLIKQGRERFTALLQELGLRYTPSYGNFVFHHTGIPIRDFQAIMKQRNFLVGRPFPPYDDWCRISIGNSVEMGAYEKAMRAVFAA